MISIIEESKKCAICGTTKMLTKYYIFKDKKKSELYGCWCWLCIEHYIKADKNDLKKATIREFAKRYKGVDINKVFK